MPRMADDANSGVAEVTLQVPLDLYALYRELAEDSGVAVHEALIQGLHFAIRSRRARPRRRTRPLPSAPATRPTPADPERPGGV